MTMYGYCQEKIDVGHYYDLKVKLMALNTNSTTLQNQTQENTGRQGEFHCTVVKKL